MPKKTLKTYDRLLDANFNRAKEGLRVCEDVCRFIYDERVLTRRFKDVRHKLTSTLISKKNGFIHARDIEGDVGKASNVSELKRKDIEDIFYANTQRVKESLRVLEEFTKVLRPKKAGELKKLRYEVYALERKAATKR